MAQLKPSISITDAKVKVFDYETGKKIKTYKLAELLIIETERKRLEKVVRYQEIGLFDEVIEDIVYTVDKMEKDASYYYLELSNNGEVVMMRIARRESGDVQILLRNELYYIKGTITTRNL
ncbi:hypothetical protein [Brumimicrobium mesophilum]|uniref:hypothetical protein n=1 Tax=Brumimicrobium mesophilum TaxID=392717 RepID=UPI000D1418E1|nr:hypothetical protein [Brumimicrobium mesophilum]